jgi:hypothetical protein
MLLWLSQGKAAPGDSLQPAVTENAVAAQQAVAAIHYAYLSLAQEASINA